MEKHTAMVARQSVQGWPSNAQALAPAQIQVSIISFQKDPSSVQF